MATRTDRSRALTLVLPAFLALAALPAGGAAQEHGGHAMMDHAGDSAAVAHVVESFHAALAGGDSTAAKALLAPDARILEGGSIETAEEYASHHLPADMRFAAAVPRTRGPLQVTVRGDVAWAVSTSQSKGTYREREIDSRGAELVVLTRGDTGWRIQAIQWSSR